MPQMDDEVRDAFLKETRIGILSTPGHDGWPVSVPVWFEWDGSHARVFTSARSPKVARLEADARASRLVANAAGEKEAWVAIDGHVEIHEEGAFALAERLAGRYWDLSDEGHRETVELWRKAAPTLRVLELIPARIRSYDS